MPSFKNRPRAAEKAKDCAHCKKPSNRIRRGLCERCYKDHAIRAEHANLSCRREPTKEEVEEMVRKGYEKLPWWWDAETRRMAAGKDE